MDPDAEFNLLTNLYQSVVHDMKQTYPGWENLSQKAMKLGTQLKVTAQCISAFIEAMQTISDNGNNLKGASRDVGACVTRVCIKQRAIESRMKSWADALCDELALSLQQRGAYWKSRCQELDKAAAKHVKKIRSRKQRPDITAMSEQREICTKVLTEQRTQFTFFVGTLMPVLNAQINMLDEGAHLRQVVDNLENTLKHVDTDQLVSSIVNDVSQGPDTAWKQCLTEAGQKWRNADDNYSSVGGNGSIRDLSTTRATTPASTFSSDDGNHAGSVAMSSRSISTSCGGRFTKPPLQRRNSEKSIGQFSMSSPNTDESSTASHHHHHHHLMGNGSSSNTITEMTAHQPVTRASSSTLAGPPPTYQQIINQRCIMARPSNLSIDGWNQINQTTTSLIAEACKEIDQLGSDLENYCNQSHQQQQQRYYIHEERNGGGGGGGHQILNRRASHAGEIQQAQIIDAAKRASVSTLGCSKMSNYNNPHSTHHQGVRMRTTSSSSSSRPPPPTRRSSQITAATPTAPSVAEQRMNGSMAGSRQSLDSAGLYDNTQPSQLFQMTSFARQTGPPLPPPSASAAKFRI